MEVLQLLFQLHKNVGIGTTSPSEKLHVVGGAATVKIESSTNEASLKYDNSTTTGAIKLANNDLKTELGGSEVMRILANGNFGIGTSSPSYLLDVESSSTGNVTLAQFKTNESTYNGLLVAANNNAGWIGNGTLVADEGILFQDTSSAMRFYTASSERMRIDSSGNVGIGTTPLFGHKFSVQASTDKNFTVDDNNGTGISLNAYNNSGSNVELAIKSNIFSVHSATAERFRITNAGNVGIGTSSPARRLSVIGTTRPAEFGSDNAVNVVKLYNSATGSSTYNGLDLSVNSTSNANINAYGMPLTFRTSASNGTNVSERMRIDSSGDVQIGTTASIASATLTTVSSGNTHQVMRSSNASAGEYWRQEVDASNDFYLIDNTSTGVYITDGSTSWSGLSDENLKENIVELTGVLDKVKDFRCVKYNLIADEDSSKKIGFIAQDWQEDYSEVVSQDNDGNLGMKYTETIPVLLKAIQEQQTLIESLEARITTLEG